MSDVETEENPLAGLVQAALDKDYNKANEIFGDAISVKLNDVMDQERIKLAGQIYNGEPEDEEDEIDPETESDDEEEEDGATEEEDENSSE